MLTYITKKKGSRTTIRGKKIGDSPSRVEINLAQISFLNCP